MVRVVKSLPRVIIETSFVNFLHHLRSQNGGEFVCYPGRQMSPWIRVSHVAEGATLAAQGGDQEACQVGQSPDKASLLREVSVEDTVVDDVILLWCL